MSKISEIINNSNNRNLLRCETDNVHGDANLQKAHFHPLIKDTHRSIDKNNDKELPKATRGNNENNFFIDDR